MFARHRSGFPAATASLLAVCSLAPAASAQGVRLRGVELLHQQHHDAQVQFAADMTELAGFCDGHGYAEDAARIRQLAVPVGEQTLNVDSLPEKTLPDLPVDLPPAEREWRAKLRKLQIDYAQELFLLSQRAIKEGHPSEAFELIREVAFHNPDHPRARALLGYVRHDDGWTTPFAREKLKRGHVWTDRFGWVLSTQLARYENGERFYNAKWMSAEKEAAIRSDFRYGWEVLTEHFEIHTNHSLERGVELGVALEDYHRFFVREFAGFFNTPQQMKALFDGGSADVRGNGKRYQIHYYRSRDEYVRRLKAKQPNIEVTNGLYLPADRVAYFYDDPANADGNLATMFHEVTHQLLGESAPSIRDVASDANFWLVEGLACYMESFRREGGRLSVGDPQHIRMQWARVRVLDENFFVPLPQFTALGMRQFQYVEDKPTLQRYYSQASGMAHFFMHYRDGVYRDALIAHLSQVYSPNPRIRDRVQGLDVLTGVSYSELEAQYKQYLAAQREKLGELPAANAGGGGQ